MANNKVLLGNEVLIDLTDSTVNPNVLLAGYKAYDASGNAITGEFSPSYHITLTQAQYDQLSQTEKMADENFFYITDAVVVGADIDDTTTSTTKVWSSSKTNTELSAKANSADVPTKAQITNPNLLDNPWFTINQRGLSSYTADVMSVDRWRSGFNSQVGVTSTGITLSQVDTSQVSVFFQLFEDATDNLNGKIVTISLLDGSGNLYTLGGTVVHNTVWTPVFSKTFNDTFTIQLTAQPIDNGIYRYSVDITTNATKTLTVRAIKLELGSISTLALDTAPNYATELLKCQRYFVRYNGNNSFDGYVFDTTTARIVVPVKMRTTPSVVYTVGNSYPQIIYNGSSVSLSANTPLAVVAYTAMQVLVNITGLSGLSANYPCLIKTNTGTLDFTADL